MRIYRTQEGMFGIIHFQVAWQPYCKNEAIDASNWLSTRTHQHSVRYYDSYGSNIHNNYFYIIYTSRAIDASIWTSARYSQNHPRLYDGLKGIIDSNRFYGADNSGAICMGMGIKYFRCVA